MPGMSSVSTKKSPSPQRWMRLVAACVLLGAAAVSAAPAPADAPPATYQAPAAYLQAMKLAEAAVSAAGANATSTTTTTSAPATTTIGSSTIVGTTTFLPGGDRIEPRPGNHLDSISPGKANQIIVDHLKAQAQAYKEAHPSSSSSSSAAPAQLMETLPVGNPDAAGAQPGAVAAWNQAAGVQHQAEMFEQARKNEGVANGSTPQGAAEAAGAGAAKSRSLHWARDAVMSEVGQVREQVRREAAEAAAAAAAQQEQHQLKSRESPANWMQASGVAEQAARLQQQKAAYAAQVQRLKEQSGAPPTTTNPAPAQAQGALAQAAAVAPAPATDAAAAAPGSVVDSADQDQATAAAPAAAPAPVAALDPTPPAKRVFLRWNKSSVIN